MHGMIRINIPQHHLILHIQEYPRGEWKFCHVRKNMRPHNFFWLPAARVRVPGGSPFSQLPIRSPGNPPIPLVAQRLDELTGFTAGVMFHSLAGGFSFTGRNEKRKKHFLLVWVQYGIRPILHWLYNEIVLIIILPSHKCKKVQGIVGVSKKYGFV